MTMFTDKELAEEITRRNGRSITSTAVALWRIRGVQGHRLPYKRIGGIPYVRWEWYEQWQAEVDELKDYDNRARQRRRRVIA